MSDVREWLDSIGLGQYADAFEENELDWGLLPDLDHDILRDIGIAAAGARIRILRAVKALNLDATISDVGDPAPRSGGDAERRQLTVMFCDLVGSTALSDSMDPEDYRELLRQYQTAATGAIQVHGGYVARYMGDGLLAYFGYPMANEDDPERAVMAALDAVERVNGLNGSADQALRVRVGVATGSVVVGDIVGEGASEERAVVGDTPNLAARLQSLAAPNEVLIGPETYHLTEGLFDCKDYGEQQFKGISSLVRVYRVMGEGTAPSRFEAAASRGLTPLVGRRAELQLLQERWQRVLDGEGQLVTVSGEAGVGKSRLVRAFRDGIVDSANQLRWYCSPHRSSTALYPLTDALSRALRLREIETVEETLDRLIEFLEDLNLPVDTHGFALGEALGVPTDTRFPDPELSPQALRHQTFETFLALIGAMALRSPTLIVLEDAHWLDPTTAEFVGLSTERIARERVLLVITHRPEFSPPWPSLATGSALTIGTLSRAESVTLVGHLIEGKSLPAEVMDSILDRTSGMPLYAEEVTDAVLHSGMLTVQGDHYLLASEKVPTAIPTTLQDSLTARLDRLSISKECAQAAAVFGRRFTREALRTVLSGDVPLDDALEELVQAGVVYPVGSGGGGTFEFKHALVQESAYRSLLKSVRQRIHRAVASVWQAQDAEAELVAHHLAEAGEIARSIPLWQAAAASAMARSANAEAIAHLTRGIELLHTLPEARDRDQHELELQLALGPALTVTRGFSAPETENAYARARELAERSGTQEQVFDAAIGLWGLYLIGGRFDSARSLAETAMTLTEGSDLDSEYRLQAYHVAWTTGFTPGEHRRCVELADEGLALYDRDKHASHKFRYLGHDPGVCAGALSAISMWLMGYPENAVTRAHQAIELAEDLHHPASIAHANSFFSWVGMMSRDREVGERHSEAALAIGSKHHLGFYILLGTLGTAWSSFLRSPNEADLTRMKNGVNQMLAMRMGTLVPFNLCFLAEAQFALDEVEEALATLDEAERLANDVNDHFWTPELHRLRGAFLLQSGQQQSEAQASFEASIRIAQQHEARSLELRASTSLAQLWSDQGKNDEARILLAPICEWFRAGRSSPDFEEASALLHHVSRLHE